MLVNKIIQRHGSDLQAQIESIAKVGEALKQALSVNSGVVPVEFATDVFRALRDVSVMRKICRIKNMGRDTKLTSVGGATAAYSYIAGTRSESTFSLTPVQLTARIVSCLLYIPKEDIEDLTDIDLYAEVVADFAAAIAAFEDQEFIQGTGATISGSFTKITGLCKRIFPTYAATAAVGSPTDGSYQSIPYAADNEFALIKQAERSALEQGAAEDDLVWLTSHVGYEILSRAVADDGHPIFHRDPTSKGPATLNGYPIYRTSHVPKTYGTGSDETLAILGPFGKQAVIGNRNSLTASTSTDYKFASQELAILLEERVDFAVGKTAAFVAITGIK